MLHAIYDAYGRLIYTIVYDILKNREDAEDVTALDANATSVVLAHNHPSGVALPSEEDKRVTQVIRDALDAGEFAAFRAEYSEKLSERA